MSNPILQILNAGRGTTPEWPEAKFQRADVVRIRRLKHLRHLPGEAAVFCVVPPGFPAEYALADAAGRARPLMIAKPLNCGSYIVGFVGDPRPQLLRESDLLPSNKPPAEIGWTTSSTEDATAQGGAS